MTELDELQKILLEIQKIRKLLLWIVKRQILRDEGADYNETKVTDVIK